jgi:hypothetical protein
MYKIYPPPGNVIGQMCRAISVTFCLVTIDRIYEHFLTQHAISKKFKDDSAEKPAHWLDYASDKFEASFDCYRVLE